jgi:hypothetical protein
MINFLVNPILSTHAFTYRTTAITVSNQARGHGDGGESEINMSFDPFGKVACNRTRSVLEESLLGHDSEFRLCSGVKASG